MSDPERTYTADEDERLARNLQALNSAIHRGELCDVAPTPGLLDHFHFSLFEGVRGHAGRHRRSGFGQEHLSFGPNRSLHRSQVPHALDDIFKQLQRSIRSLDANPSAENYEESALQIALWVHAETIRIHPFEDGNGRSSRALMNWVLVRAGLRPLAIEVPRQEYLACLNVYFERRDFEPLLDLALRLYPID